LSVTYYYYRYHRPYSEEIESLPRALARARYDVEYQEASPQKIVLEDGTELDDEEILERSGYYADVDVYGTIIESTATQLDLDTDEMTETGLQ